MEVGGKLVRGNCSTGRHDEWRAVISNSGTVEWCLDEIPQYRPFLTSQSFNIERDCLLQLFQTSIKYQIMELSGTVDNTFILPMNQPSCQ